MIQKNNLHFTFQTFVHLTVTVVASAQFQKVDIPHMDLMIFDYVQFHDHVKILVLDIVIAIQNSPLIKLHDVQDRLKYINNGENLDLIVDLLSEVIAFIFFLKRILEINSILEVIILHIHLHQNHVEDLSVHLEVL